MLVLKRKETNSCRGLEFRIDAFGIYLLAFEGEDLCAGISYQYPAWFSELFSEPNNFYVRNSFNIFNWGSPMITQDDIDAFMDNEESNPKITAEAFKKATGYEPVNDDLERCNCTQAGETGHYFCGWNYTKNLPQFMTEPLINSRRDSSPEPKPARYYSLD